MEKDKSIPYNSSSSTITEKTIDFFSREDNYDNDEYLLSENGKREIMALQEEIANVFIAHKTEILVSCQVLSAMADAVYSYMLFDLEKEE